MTMLSGVWAKVLVMTIAAGMTGCTVVNVTVTDGEESATDGEDTEGSDSSEGSQGVTSGYWGTSGNVDTSGGPWTSCSIRATSASRSWHRCTFSPPCAAVRPFCTV